jgi:hypothetical protein
MRIKLKIESNAGKDVKIFDFVLMRNKFESFNVIFIRFSFKFSLFILKKNEFWARSQFKLNIRAR